MAAAKIRLYRPGSGTEGDSFIANWCGRCARDKPLSQGIDFDSCDPSEVCHIVAMTLACDIKDPEYPREWRYDADGHPCCTAFVEVGTDIPITRCEYTIDMFEAAP